MLPKAYDPGSTEDRIYQMWEESGAFVANRDSGKETFTISMPPPNATGQLHLGHAVMLALEDIFIRYERMKGKEALWIPGTDHAAIATENVVISKLQKEGIKNPREELGREKVIEEIKKFVAGSRDTIRSQVKKMGSSCDWSRERYTMDQSLNRCVNEVFKKMYEDEIIYRGHRIVNWDPNLQTNVSDDEVEYKEKKDPFYVFQYGPFEIGTVRPETKFGDKYVVMHPDDKRYKQYKHGDTFECEWITGKITATVIKDDSVDPEMGTGVMTITPWHSHVDFEIAERHGLDKQQIIDFDGKLMDCAGEFAGMHIEKARPKIVELLEKKGLLVKTDENYVHTVATNSRGKGVIEPQIREQWFIDVNKEAVDWQGKKMSLKQVMQSVVRDGDIKIIPERFDKTYFHWIDNLRDWCISRQIWWGHRIPVYYCDACSAQSSKLKAIVSAQLIEKCPHCGGSVHQDSDTLDTWFSSALWTWSTLVDSAKAEDFSLDLQQILEQSPDYQHFHPTQVMETGYDILFFWVARMILMTTYVTGQVPFETVYLHGLIRTRDGSKMSKSHPETMIDPLDIIPKYGADALRMSMIVGQSPGNDQKLFEEKIAGYRNFINKLWNASRFVLMQCEDAGIDPATVESGQLKVESLSLADKALLSELQDVIEDVTKGLDAYRLSEVGERLYSFTWDYFCDWYLELSKGETNHAVLIHGLRTILQLLHPYCPFVTEELWAQFKAADDDMLLKMSWPVADMSLKNDQAQAQLQLVIEAISAIRKLRSDQGIEPGKQLEVSMVAKDAAKLLEAEKGHIERLGKCALTLVDAKPAVDHLASAFIPGVEIYVSLEGLIDFDKEKERLTKEKAQLEGFLKSVNAKLGNKKFVDNAAPEIVQLERDKQASAEEKLGKIEARLQQLG